MPRAPGELARLAAAGLAPWRPPSSHAGAGSAARRGAAVLETWGLPVPTGSAAAEGVLAMALPELGATGPGRAGLAQLTRAVAHRDPATAAEANARLIGLGAGRTPAGDDVVMAAAATVAVLGPTRFRGRRTWLDAMIGDRLGARTEALSVALLELARTGALIEPAARLLDLSPAGEAGWPAALERLRTVGGSTGRAHAVTVGVCAVLVDQG